MDTKAAFEKWLKEKMPNLYHLAFIAKEDEMTNHFKASVFDMRTAWESSWKESRAAVEIALPKEIITRDHGPMISKERTMAVLAYNGIRIKGKTE